VVARNRSFDSEQALFLLESELVPACLKGSVRPWVRKARTGLRKIGY
jgi:hypothetical protein